MLFLFFFIKKKSFPILLFSLLLVFLSKFPGPILLIFSLFIFIVITKQWKEVPRIFLLFFITAVIFLIILFSYLKIMGSDPLMPFIHNFKGRSAGWFSYLGIIKSAWAFKSFFYFIIPFFFLLFVFFSFWFYREIWKVKIPETKKNLLLFNITALFPILFYTYL